MNLVVLAHGRNERMKDLELLRDCLRLEGSVKGQGLAVRESGFKISSECRNAMKQWVLAKISVQSPYNEPSIPSFPTDKMDLWAGGPWSGYQELSPYSHLTTI